MVITAQELIRIAKERGHTNAAICNAVDWDRTTLWRWENGRNTKANPPPAKLAKLIALVNS